MTKRIVLAGALGGIAMFLWASLAHMVLPLGSLGIREMPDERPLLDLMHSSLGGSSGFYMFPALGAGGDMRAYEQKLASNPSGLLIYHPPGAAGFTPARLITEFLTELLEALLLAWLIAQSRFSSMPARLGLAAAIGLLAAATTNIPYWNWYGFPVSYTAAYMTTEFVGIVIAGLVAARTLGSMSRRVPAAAAAAA